MNVVVGDRHGGQFCVADLDGRLAQRFLTVGDVAGSCPIRPPPYSSPSHQVPVFIQTKASPSGQPEGRALRSIPSPSTAAKRRALFCDRQFP